MIKLTNISKKFGHSKRNSIIALNNIDLTLPNNGLVAILGKSGSGKTTLLNIISGL